MKWRPLFFICLLLRLSYAEDNSHKEFQSENCNGTVFVLHHRPFWVYESSILKPLHVGKKSSPFRLDMIGDDTGDNISDRNSLYDMMTAMYWAWKNPSAGDFIGFFHYRRYLDTSLDSDTKSGTKRYYNNTTKDTSQPELYRTALDSVSFINEQNICELMREYDVLVPFKHFFGNQSIAQQYCNGQSFLDVLIEVLLKKYPEYRMIIDRTFHVMHEGYMQNRFIMRSPLFQEYANWVFPILFEIENILLTRSDNTPDKTFRIFGYMSERLLNVFLEIKKEGSNIKIKELPTLLINDVEGEKTVY